KALVAHPASSPPLSFALSLGLALVGVYGGFLQAGLGIVLYNIVLSGLAIGLLILGFARPAPATA
ncbi:MAG: hypothetical protein ACK5CS_21345, partial [Bradyrhizobium sp.]